jgi:hypothetical protein
MRAIIEYANARARGERVGRMKFTAADDESVSRITWLLLAREV